MKGETLAGQCLGGRVDGIVDLIGAPKAGRVFRLSSLPALHSTGVGRESSLCGLQSKTRRCFLHVRATEPQRTSALIASKSDFNVLGGPRHCTWDLIGGWREKLPTRRDVG